jgi:hypothetical protein
LRFYNFADIRAVGDCAALAQSLYGATVKNGRCAATWRGGDNPEMVTIDREKFYDHKVKRGGGIIELAAMKFNGDKQMAQAMLGEIYHLTPRVTTGPQPEADCRHAKLLREGYVERTRYLYRDMTGATRHITVRMEHPEKDKTFVQGHMNGDGRIHWTLKGVETLLYRMPEIAASSWALVCEGEKSANRLAALGIPATTAPMGASKWRDSYTEALAGKHVAIAPDNDAPGIEHAQTVARALHGKAASIRIVGPLAAAAKGGIDDWLDEAPDRDADAVLAAIAATPEWSPPAISGSGPSAAALAEAKTANTIPFRNYIPVKVETEKRGRKVEDINKEPRSHASMTEDLFRRFLGFPRKVGDELLFDHDRDSGDIIYLRDSDRLMAWIARRSKHNPDWCRGDAMATQRQFMASVQDAAHRYESISLIPSWPRRRDVYYAHGSMPEPCPKHSRFRAFLDMFLPATENDKCLLAAMICTPLWYIPGISRPSWIIDSREGKGCGKTTLVELVAQLYGHAPISTTRTELTQHMDVVKKRCVSQKGRDARVFLVDNVTGDFHCDELSGLITAKDITGMAPYGYGEETRPNDLVYCITANSAIFSDSDIPERSLFITVRRPDASQAGQESWRGAAQDYVDRHRLEIVSDIIHMLETHTPYDTPCRTRFREFESRILQPCCGSQEMTERVLDHVSGVRQDSSIAEDQARAMADVFGYEIETLGLDANAPCFLSSEIVNAWGRRALNDSSGPEYKGRPIQLVRNLAKAGLLPKVDIDYTRLERDGKRIRHSGLGWGTTDSTNDVFLIRKNGNGQIEWLEV